MSDFDAARLPLEGTQLIEASAGTGKTYTIATLFTRFTNEPPPDFANFDFPAERKFGWLGPYVNWKRDINHNDWPDDPWGNDYIFFTRQGGMFPKHFEDPVGGTTVIPTSRIARWRIWGWTISLRPPSKRRGPTSSVSVAPSSGSKAVA